MVRHPVRMRERRIGAPSTTGETSGVPAEGANVGAEGPARKPMMKMPYDAYP